MRKWGWLVSLVLLLPLYASLQSKIKKAIVNWDRNAYLSLFADPFISEADEVFRFRPEKVEVLRQGDFIILGILRKPFPLIEVWRIKEKDGKIVYKKVISSIKQNAYYSVGDAKCYRLKEASINLPDLKVNFSGGKFCSWPDIFLFEGEGRFVFTPSDPVEKRALLYQIGEDRVEEKISFMALRLQRQPGADVKFTIGEKLPLEEKERKLFLSQLKNFGLYYSPILKAEVLPPVPVSGAVAIMGKGRTYKYTYDPSAEREIFFTDLQAGKYLALYSPPGKVAIFVKSPKPEFINLKVRLETETNTLNGRAEISFPEPVKGRLYFYLAPDLNIADARDEKGRPLILEKSYGGTYEVYPNGSLTRIAVNYRGKVNRVESYSSLAGGYFYPTSWYPSFGGYFRYRLDVNARGADLVVPGDKRGGYYESTSPVSYIGLGMGKIRGSYAMGPLEIYWERKRLRDISLCKVAFNKVKKSLGPLPWKVKVLLSEGLFYYGASSPGLVFLRIIPLPRENIYRPGPMPCGEKYLVYHEFIHQWIGGLISPKTFSDYWVNEGLTALLSGVFSSRGFEGKFRKTFIGENRVPPLEMGGRIGYYKGSIRDVFVYLHYRAALVLNMARIYMGEEKFLQAVRDFLRENRFKEYRWEDFTTFLEKRMGKPGFFLPWVETDFNPEFSFKYSGGILKIKERRGLEIAGKKMHFQIPILIKTGGKEKILWVNGEGSIKVPPDFKIEEKLLPAVFYREK